MKGIKKIEVYTDEVQEKLHKSLKMIIQAFNQDDLIFYKEKIKHFYESPALKRQEVKLYSEMYKKDYSLGEFQTKCYLWLNTVFFDFTKEEITAIIQAGKIMKKQNRCTDDFLLYVLTAQPRKYKDDSVSFVPKRVQLKKISENEKVDFNFFTDGTD